MIHNPNLLVATLFAVVMLYMLSLWAISIKVGEPSFIDAGWGFGFVVIAAATRLVTEGDSARSNTIVIAASLWGCRLAIHLFARWRREGPDKRYAAMLKKVEGNKHVYTLTHVFLLQGGLMWLVSMPIQLGQLYSTPHGMTLQSFIGVAIVAIGIGFESIGDFQLQRFKADAANHGLVMDHGLWRYTRHPNYFGDSLVWCGLFLIGVVNAPTMLGILGPLLMTFLLLKFSGVPILERGLKRRRPGYEDYMRRTSGFIPMRPRKQLATPTDGQAPQHDGT